MFGGLLTPVQVGQRVPMPYCKFFTESRDVPAPGGGLQTVDVDFVSITVPGTRDGPTHEVATWLDVTRQNCRNRPQDYPPQLLEAYEQAYAAYKRKEAPPVDGTPIKSWSALTPSQIKRCVDSNVFTIEALRDANAQTLTAIGMDAQRLQNAARAYFEEMVSSGAILRRMQDLEAQLAMVKDQAAHAERRAAAAEQRAGPAPAVAEQASAPARGRVKA